MTLVGEQVFLTGSADELGRWDPAAVPMTRTNDNRGRRSCPYGRRRELR